jgi:hypothetical protein
VKIQALRNWGIQKSGASKTKSGSRKPEEKLFLVLFFVLYSDGVVKTRHPGENRGDVFCNHFKFLDTGWSLPRRGVAGMTILLNLGFLRECCFLVLHLGFLLNSDSWILL